MGKKKKKRTEPERLQREGIFQVAVELADKDGLPALSMRKLAAQLGVQAMSLYHHLAGKEELLDGMVDLVFAEIELPEPDRPWREAMQARAHSARRALLNHPWAVGMLDSRRNPGPATLRHHDAVLGCLRRAGFSLALSAHAFSVIDSYIYGFVLQETSLPFDDSEELAEVAEGIQTQLPADEFPYLAEMIQGHALQPDYAYANEFPFGLDLILDGLERLRESGQSGQVSPAIRV